MKITRTDNGKFSLKKLSWNEYCRLADAICQIADHELNGNMQYKVMGLVMREAEKRLSKTDTWPMNDTHYRKDKLSITLTAAETLTLWSLYPSDNADPTLHQLNLYVPQFLL